MFAGEPVFAKAQTRQPAMMVLTLLATFPAFVLGSLALQHTPSHVTARKANATRASHREIAAEGRRFLRIALGPPGPPAGEPTGDIGHAAGTTLSPVALAATSDAVAAPRSSGKEAEGSDLARLALALDAAARAQFPVSRPKAPRASAAELAQALQRVRKRDITAAERAAVAGAVVRSELGPGRRVSEVVETLQSRLGVDRIELWAQEEVHGGPDRGAGPNLTGVVRKLGTDETLRDDAREVAHEVVGKMRVLYEGDGRGGVGASRVDFYYAAGTKVACAAEDIARRVGADDVAIFDTNRKTAREVGHLKDSDLLTEGGMYWSKRTDRI